jgi:hypothetical protein
VHWRPLGRARSVDTNGCYLPNLRGEAVYDRMRAQEVDLPEPWPVDVGEVQLGVRQLPQQEVGDALLARGPKYEVGIGEVRGV